MAVIKIVELVGTSEKGWEDAVKNSVAKASETIRNIRGIDVLGWTAKVKDGKICEYKANIKISFAVE